MFRYPNTGTQGFGLLEVLISAAIIAMIAGATVALATNAVRTSILSGDRGAALGLSQEGVELVRQMRDTTYVDGLVNRWNQQPGVAESAAKLQDCTTPCQLQQVGSTWQLNPGTQTITLATGQATTTFTRGITVTQIPWYTATSTGVPNNDLASGGQPLALQVTSTVTWQEQGRTISVDSSTFLTDWRPTQ